MQGSTVAENHTPSASASAFPGGSAHPDLTALLDHRAGLTPDALALIEGDTLLTYRQLVGSARGLAAHLVTRGVRPGDPVALLVRRSARAVVAQIALWWAGAVCVPLDPAHPRVRTEAMIDDSGAVLTVGDKDLLESAGVDGPRLALDAGIPAYDGVQPLPGPGEDATAFIMFTSGSTGRPKGVAVRHRAVAALVTDPAYVTVTARDRVLLHSPATFDASTFEVWVALANGAAVVVCPADRPSFEDLAREVERHGATVAFFTTALFHQLAARRSRVFSLLRSVVVGGETLSALHARSVLRDFPWLELVNGYGPTETTTFATAHRVTAEDGEGPMPIGRPIAGATAHVLDEDGRPVAAGEHDGDHAPRGELWVGGSRLARGYVGQPELTAERFVTHPALGLLYRTGDLASVRPDGTLDFHGRTDDQVKVRGHRIEPGEIEHVLRAQPEVDDAAVTVRRPAPDDARLAAFVVPAPGSAPSPQSLRARLTATLPAHLVPDELTVLDRLPLTPTGKVDRAALADLDRRPTAGAVPGAETEGPGAVTAPGAATGTEAASSPGPAAVPGPAAAPALPASEAGTSVHAAPRQDGAPHASRTRSEGRAPGGGGTEAGPDPTAPSATGARAEAAAPAGPAPGPVAAASPAVEPVPEPAAAAHAPSSREETVPGAPALTPLQQAVAEVWARSLGCEVTSPDDDFLALGGHSLLALVVTDDLREDLGVELSLADFFASPTVAGHAALVERALLAAHTDLHPLPGAHPLPDSYPLPTPDAPEHPDVP
ncbi:non-ribosomal peptide synthetase (plasmid) [Streptomyces sp. CA-294286]|uniref:non-ribosomal peptide synthetase n=1 Tax=Streptomyces sp. CA-294286 TaxID=3240070 RepID=UPI003D8E6D78